MELSRRQLDVNLRTLLSQSYIERRTHQLGRASERCPSLKPNRRNVVRTGQNEDFPAGRFTRSKGPCVSWVKRPPALVL